jgi:hypothetical protein
MTSSTSYSAIELFLFGLSYRYPGGEQWKVITAAICVLWLSIQAIVLLSIFNSSYQLAEKSLRRATIFAVAGATPWFLYLCEHLIRLSVHAPVPFDRYWSTSPIALWMFVGPVLFVRSYVRQPWGASGLRNYELKRIAQVIAWVVGSGIVFWPGMWI